MTDYVSPEFHAELIVELFNDYGDLRKVRERARLPLSRASPEHLKRVGRNLPAHLVHVLPRHELRIQETQLHEGRSASTKAGCAR
jgi:hypothetical protein